MEKEKKKKCRKIIHSAAVGAAGVGGGMAQLPGMDVPVIVGIEVTMTIALGAVFGISLTESAAKSIVLATAGTIAGRGITQGLIGWMPGIGNLINASTAFAIVEALGWAIANDFANKENRGKDENIYL